MADSTMETDLNTVSQAVSSLSDKQALAAGSAFIVLLDDAMQETKATAGEVDVTDPKQLLASAGTPERALYDRFSGASEEELAGAARRLLLLGGEIGYGDLVLQACEEAKTHVRDFGVFTGPLIVAGLAVVLAWVPVEQREKVRKRRSQNADGSVVEEEEIERETVRVGAAAAEKLAPWVKTFMGLA
jgi:hypothetical protein